MRTGKEDAFNSPIHVRTCGSQVRDAATPLPTSSSSLYTLCICLSFTAPEYS